MKFDRLFLPALAAVLFTGIFCSRGFSQDDSNEDIEYKSYMELISSEYVAAAKGGKQTLKLKLNFSADLPLGTKIQMDLVHNGLPLIGETIFYTLKTSKRKGVIYDLVPKKALGVDNYYLRVQIDLEEQTGAVGKAFKGKTKIFPPRANPLVWLYGQENYAIKVGTEEEREAQANLTCTVYDDFINELVGNWNDFKSTLDAVKEGKKYSTAGVVDRKGLELYIRKWRRKMGTTQKAVLIDFPSASPAVHSKSLTAHANLLRLGRMVAKRSVSYQREFEKEAKIQAINPRLNTKDKADAVLRFFDAGFRYRVSKESLNRTMDNIYRLVCPEEEEEEKAEAAPATDPAREKPAEEGEGR